MPNTAPQGNLQDLERQKFIESTSTPGQYGVVVLNSTGGDISGGGGGSDVNIASVGGNAVTTTVPVSGTVSVTGVSTAAKQDTGNNDLAAISAATGVWFPTYTDSVDDTKFLIQGSSVQLGGWSAGNDNAAFTYVQCFNAATTAAVTLGTTPPDWVISLPGSAAGGSAANMEWTNGISFPAGLVIAATTTPTGSTPPTNPIPVSLAIR